MHVLLFDMMDTLLDDPFFLATRRLMDEAQRARWAKERNPAAFLRFEAGLCSESEYFRSFFRSGAVPDGLPSPARLKKAMMREIRWLPGIPELLLRLRRLRSVDSPIRLGLASNYSLWYRDVFRVRRDLPEIFDLMFFSCEIGYRKPSLAFYDVVHSALTSIGGEEMPRVVFFDDREENLEIPRSLGWEAVHIPEKERASSVIEEALRCRGLLDISPP